MLHHMKEVLGIFLETAISPAVATTGEVDEVVKVLKKAIVKYIVDRYEASKVTMAAHLGKSDRWLYQQLEEFEQKESDPMTAHRGHQLLYAVNQFYAAVHPKGASSVECARNLRQQGWKISTAELDPLLDLYADMGYLEKQDTPQGRDCEFRARQRTYTVKATGEHERKQLLERNAGAIFPIAVSYLRGDDVARFGMSEGEVMEKHLKEAVKDIWQYQTRRLNQAVEDSIAEDPDETGPRVRYRMMLLCGLGPFFDASKGGTT